MSSHQHATPGAFGAQRHHTSSGCGQPQPATKCGTTLTPAELEKLVPIKMQHAAAQFVIAYLANGATGYYGEETAVGGEEDRSGIDFHLKNKKEKIDIPVDFSLNGKGGFAVQLMPYWFEKQADGSYRFLTEYAQALFRAFLPAMNPDNKYNLWRWKMEQRGECAY